MRGPDDPTAAADTLIVHASCVALDGRGLLIRGRSGSGKSGLALQLMAYGALLVSDDRLLLSASDGAVIASAPKQIRGLIEARGLGLLNARTAPSARVIAVVDMDRVEDQRLPHANSVELAGSPVPLLCKVDSPHFGAMLIQYLKGGRQET